MSYIAVRVFRGGRSLLAPAFKATSFVDGATTENSKTESKTEPTGFFKPAPVSPALSRFLGTAEISGYDAVKEIVSYIGSHNLQNPANKREFFCDEKLKLIFDGKDKVGAVEGAELLAAHFAKKSA